MVEKMAKSRKKIKLKSPKKLFGFFIVLLIIIALIFGGVKLFNVLFVDSVIKDIQTLENQKVTLIDKQIKQYMGENETNATTLSAENIVTYRVIYRYQLQNGTIKNYPVDTGLTIEVSDTAYATVVKNTIVIPTGISQKQELKVTVKYKKIDDVVYTYTVEPMTAPAAS